MCLKLAICYYLPSLKEEQSVTEPAYHNFIKLWEEDLILEQKKNGFDPTQMCTSSLRRQVVSVNTMLWKWRQQMVSGKWYTQ